MNFIKHRWVNGELITASLLNRIEDAIDSMVQTSYNIATSADCDALFDDFLQDEE